MNEKTVKNRDMTSGPLLSRIVLFVLPLVATNLLQVLYNAADMVVVSLSTAPDAVGAIGTTGAFINLVVNIFIGFSTGSNVVVARHLGARDEENAQNAVHTSILISLLFGIVGGGVGLLCARPVLTLMGNEGELLRLALIYTRIYFAGVPFLSLTNYEIAILRAKGDTKTPLYTLSLAGLLNVMLNLFFVLVCGMSVDGVAYATVISNVLSAVLLGLKLMREKGPCRLSLKKLRIHGRAFRDILHIGLPAGIQGALFSVSNMLIQSSILKVNNALCPPNSEFQPVVKGNAAAANLEGFAYTATNAVYQAAITFTSQNVGAAQYERVKKVMRCCYALTFTIAVLFGGGLLLLRRPLLSLYGVVPGEEGSLLHIAYETAMTRMFITYIPYFTLAFMEVGSGVVRGLGHSVTSTAVSLVGSCLLRILWIATIFKVFGSLASIYISYPISWTLTALAHFICAMVIIRKYIRTRNQELTVSEI